MGLQVVVPRTGHYGNKCREFSLCDAKLIHPQFEALLIANKDKLKYILTGINLNIFEESIQVVHINLHVKISLS